MEKKAKTQKQMTTPKIRPKYEPPEVVTYQEDEILKSMGPVGGCVSPDYGGEAQGAPSLNSNGYRTRRETWSEGKRRIRSLYSGDM